MSVPHSDGDAPMPTALIIGASRGLGLGLADELASRGWEVTGTVRSEQDKPALEGVGAAAELADITDAASLEALRAVVRVAGPLDVLVLNAGVTGPKHQSPSEMTADEAAHLFLTNAVAPVAAARLFADLMPDNGVVAFMSSQLGSVTNARGNMPLYSASKAALNSLSRAFAAGLRRPLSVLSLHPGWVRTDMGGDDAGLDVRTSVAGLADVITARRGVPGSAFLDYKGEALPW